MAFLRFPLFISILWSAISTHQSYSLIYHALFFLINLLHHLKSTSSTNFFFGYQCYTSALIFWLPTARILPGSFLFCPIAPLLMSKFSELFPMYFLILTFFLNGLPFFCPLGQNLPPFRTHHSGIRDPNDKNETENALACQPGLPLPCSFLGACGLSVEVVCMSPGSRQRDSQSRGQRRAAALALPADALQPQAFAPDGSHQRRGELAPSHPSLQHSWLCPLLLLRQIHRLPWHYLRQKARQDLAPNQRPYRCAIGVSMSVCLCWGRAKS